MFVSFMHDTLAEVEATLAQADMMGVAALGHRTKSSAKTVGAMGFAELCLALEQCKRAEDYDRAFGIVAQMRLLLVRISEQIDAVTKEIS
jgi:HPt (histidine-containing phosphotransfer) domain-containing protein